MLYRFQSAAVNEVIMLQEHAEEVFAAMRLSLTPKGFILVANMPAAIAALEQAVEQSKKQEAAGGKTADQNEQSTAQKRIPFYTRAYPFLQMLKQSRQANREISWGR